MALQLYSRHQLLVYADVMNVLADNTNTIKKITETLLYSHQNAGPNRDIRRANIYFEKVA
jgi:hypothetical protein